MTKEEFELGYATRSNMTVAEMHKYGMFAVPAERDNACDYDGCEGWHIVRRSIWEADVKYGMRVAADLALLV